MQIRALRQDDGLSLYKCLAQNEFGTSERLIKLIVLGIPEKPIQVRLRDVWSRSALITWQSPHASDGPQTASGRISNYTIQYWRKTWVANAPQQNHRREEIHVDGLQSSALLPSLLPALTYEVSVIAHNSVGSSEPSEPVNVTTSEEEPSAPPTDVQVEARGSSSLRVMWKVPPSESLNGRLLGFYIGYRSRLAGLGLLQTPANQQPIFSFKTADAIEGQIYYDTFVTNLKHNQEYEVIVRAFNKAGSGPDCHTVLARTNSARLPQAPSLQVQRASGGSVTLRWSSTVLLSGASNGPRLGGQPQHASLEILRFVLYYQVQGERDWYELVVNRAPSSTGQQLELGQPDGTDASADSVGKPLVELVEGSNELITSQISVHTLTNLQPGLVYRVYVAAANDYGIGDPSNVVSVRTDPQSGSASLQLGSARVESAATATSVSGLLDQWTQQPHGLLYTLLSSLALIAIVVILVAYLVWQRKLRRKYNSSSGSSYPSSWTPATTDTFQSEYSVKRFAPAGAAHPLSQRQAQQLDAYERTSGALAAAGSVSPFIGPDGGRSSGATLNQIQLVRGGTSTRPVLSSHYHQPADLVSSGTLQTARSSQLQARQHQNKAITTLNRNQNRQLPPIPYSTLSVKEIGGGGGGGGPGKQSNWRQQQQQQSAQGSDYRLCNQQQQQQQQLMSGGSFRAANNKGGSQTPLIYGVIE